MEYRDDDSDDDYDDKYDDKLMTMKQEMNIRVMMMNIMMMPVMTVKVLTLLTVTGICRASIPTSSEVFRLAAAADRGTNN